MKTPYKLNSNLIDIIKRINTNHEDNSIRNIEKIVFQKYGFRISKSSINKILKKEGLSRPVGRQRKQIPILEEVSIGNMGLFFSKAADLALKETWVFAEAIKANFINENFSSLLKKIEALIFKTYFSENDENISLGLNSGFWQLIGQYLNKKHINLLYSKIENNLSTKQAIFDKFQSNNILPTYIKINLSNGQSIIIDSLNYSLTSFEKLPRLSFVSICNIKSYIELTFIKLQRPLIFLCSPAINETMPVFFTFLSAMGNPFVTNPPIDIRIIGKGEVELAKIDILTAPRKTDFIMGLFPGQVNKNIKIIAKTTFSPFKDEFIWEQFYIAEGHVTFIEPKFNEAITLRAALLRNYPQGPNRLVLITNILQKECNINDVARDYFKRWPNFEDSYLYFSQRLYIQEDRLLGRLEKNFHNILSYNELRLNDILNFCRAAIEEYIKLRFMPPIWQDFEFEQKKNLFFSLPAIISRKTGLIKINFIPAADSSIFNDLVYACNRANELALETAQLERLFFDAKIP